MVVIGQIERATQRRLVRLFIDELGYDDLGDCSDLDNSNIREAEVRSFLLGYQGYDDRGDEGEALVTRAVAMLQKVAGDTSKSLFDRNREVYQLLRYGVKVKADVGAQTETVWLIDWKHPERNRFAVAEEVTVRAANPKASDKRPDLVLYVNGIALGVLELKRASVSVAEGIRQNLDSQKREFIEPFFSTVQFVMAGNDTEGLRYGTIATKEKYFLEWKENDAKRAAGADGLNDAVRQLLNKTRWLELIHDFVVFDSGVKKLCRHNQYFGVRAAAEHVRRREGGILWHTQGSGKSLTMVWLAKWIRENVTDARVLIITDRTELDAQIKGVFFGVEEKIVQAKSAADLVAKLNVNEAPLLCSLVHKFGRTAAIETDDDVGDYLTELKACVPKDFRAKGNLFVFVDECHRSQSGDLHGAMKHLLPDAVFIGFTGTPLLKADKKKSIETFGKYIHTYKFHQAVADGVVLNLEYEARNIDQSLKSPAKIDQWFEAKTRGMSDLAKAQLKARWGTMQKVLSSRSRLEQIVADVLLDFERIDRLLSGRGNAMLVAGSIYEACKYYELFARTPLKGHCAIVSSYVPKTADAKGEDSGEGLTDQLDKYGIYRQMLADWFNEPAENAALKVDEFERQCKERFIKEPGRLKLLIVVDKLLTGFDAPPATVLYIDKQMRDHGLFQAICRVNRLDGDDKEFGLIVDYKDLFRLLDAAVQDYTTGALDKYDKEDVKDLLQDRLKHGRMRLEDALEQVRALCEPVAPPYEQAQYFAYFAGAESGNGEELKASEPQRLSLYTFTAALVRAYANLAGEMQEAGYSLQEASAIKAEVTKAEKLRSEVKMLAGDNVDLKQYEPAMRHLIDTYIEAAVSEKVSEFENLSLVELIVKRGADAVEHLPNGIRKRKEAVAETIENNVRRLIVNETPINPKYYERMSELLDALIEQRREGAMDYEAYLAQIVELTRTVAAGPAGAAGGYPAAVTTKALRAMYDNTGRDEGLAVRIDAAVRSSMQDGWRDNMMKTRRVQQAVRSALAAARGEDDDTVDEALVARIVELAKNQHEY